MDRGGAFFADAFVGGSWRRDTSGGVGRRLSPHTGLEVSLAALCGDEEVVAARRHAALPCLRNRLVGGGVDFTYLQYGVW